MKTGLAVVLALALGWGATGCGRSPQKTITDQADRFFARLRDAQVAEAYAMLAEESRQETGVEAFQQGVEALGFVGNRGVVWDPPYIDDDYGTIEGVVTTRDGPELRQELVFFKKGGTWAIHIVREPVDRTALDLIVAARLQQPDPEGMGRLAMGTIRLLAEALDGGDFTAFHRATAPILREQTTPEVFQESFEWLASSEVGFDWAAVRDVPPVFDTPPVVDAGGVLSMKGFVPAGDKRLGFELQYVYVLPEWMPISINIRPPL
jgi:hypothetical protein